MVGKEFQFLEEEFNFSSESITDTGRTYFIDYRKDELIVRILYSVANTFIEATIYNHVSKVSPGKYSWKYSVNLAHLMEKSMKNFDYRKDYESFMPSRISIEKSISTLAKLFREYASAILKNREWISWGEITGYKQYVPSDLP